MIQDFGKCKKCGHFLGQHVIKQNGKVLLNWSQWLKKFNHVREGCYINQCKCLRFL